MGRRKLARILLEGGPDFTIRNQQKETAGQIAERKGHKEIAELIRNPPEVVDIHQQQEDDYGTRRGKEIVDGVEVIEGEAGGEAKKRHGKRSKGGGHSKVRGESFYK